MNGETAAKILIVLSWATLVIGICFAAFFMLPAFSYTYPRTDPHIISAIASLVGGVLWWALGLSVAGACVDGAAIKKALEQKGIIDPPSGNQPRLSKPLPEESKHW